MSYLEVFMSEMCDVEDNIEDVVIKDGDELLIDLVKAYPHIYDKRDPNYKDNLMKNNSWEEIAKIMKKSSSECQNRWLRLRDKYSRERKKYIPSGSAGGHKEWLLFKYMDFLSEHVTQRKRFTNITLPRSSLVTTLNSNISKENDQGDGGTNNKLQPNHSSSGGVTDSCTWPKRRKKQEAIDESFIDLSSAIKSHLNASLDVENDADHLFCKFIAAELKKKNDETKERLKKEIVNLIFQT